MFKELVETFFNPTALIVGVLVIFFLFLALWRLESRSRRL